MIQAIKCQHRRFRKDRSLVYQLEEVELIKKTSWKRCCQHTRMLQMKKLMIRFNRNRSFQVASHLGRRTLIWTVIIASHRTVQFQPWTYNTAQWVHVSSEAKVLKKWNGSWQRRSEKSSKCGLLKRPRTMRRISLTCSSTKISVSWLILIKSLRFSGTTWVTSIRRKNLWWLFPFPSPHREFTERRNQ